MFRLILESVDGGLRSLPLHDQGGPEGEGWRIGRSLDGDVVLRWPGVSKDHARLLVEDGEFWLIDAGSKNGLVVDGERRRRVRLVPGRAVQIGRGFLSLEEIDTEEVEIGLCLGPQEVSYASQPSVDAADTDHVSGVAGVRCSALDFPPQMVVGRSSRLAMLHHELARAIRADLPIVLQGPTGVGKELYARTVHRSGPRRDGPFVAVQADAMPRDQLEAELFGIEAGAATGVHARPGLAREAHGGTLFFDEIGDLAPDLQGRLLRLLQERKVRPVGGRREVAVDVGIVAATHRDLHAAVEQGAFREDLFYRLAGLLAEVPPLATRPEDIPPLIADAATRAARRLGIRVGGVSRRALNKLLAETWPGNVRQLQWSVRGAVARARDGEVRQSSHFGWPDAGASLRAQLPPPPELAGPPRPLKESLEAAERPAILDALRWSGGNKTKAAEALGISPGGLRMKIKRLGLE